MYVMKGGVVDVNGGAAVRGDYGGSRGNDVCAMIAAARQRDEKPAAGVLKETERETQRERERERLNLCVQSTMFLHTSNGIPPPCL